MAGTISPGIPFLSLRTLAEVGELDATVAFVNEPNPVPTRYPTFLILHNPPPIRERDKAFAVAGTSERVLIATSRYAVALSPEKGIYTSRAGTNRAYRNHRVKCLITEICGGSGVI